MLENVVADIRFALRWLRRSPGFTFIAVASFAVGIGFNTALFSLVDAVLFKPLPVHQPERLVDVYVSSNHDRYATSSYLDLLDIKAQNAVFEDLIGYSPMFAALSLGDRSRLVMGEVVTSNYFRMLGVTPSLGRSFTSEEDRPGAEPSVMVSEPFWRRELAGDPKAVGRRVRLRGRPFTVVGVVPAGFGGMLPIVAPEVWVPIGQVEEVEPAGIQHNLPSPTGNTRLERRGQRWMFVKGRLKPNVTVAQARANVETIMARLAAEYPQTNKDMKPAVVRTSDVHIHPEAGNLLSAISIALMVVVGLVLLVGCANVASMLLARAAARQKEIAIRLSIGAGRGRLIQQLLTESIVLAVLGAAAGLILAWWLTRALASVHVPIPIPISVAVPLDARVLLFTLLVTLVAGIVSGLVPALRSARASLVGDLKGESGTHRVGSRRWTMRDALVAGQIAVTVVLLVCGGLLARSLVASQAARLGFRTEGLAVVSMDMKMAGYDEQHSRRFLDQVLENVRRIPGVQTASFASQLPFSMNFNNMTFFIPGHDAPDGRGTPIAETDVGPDYFRALDIPILQGRAFEETDDESRPGVAIVNETMAKRFWPGDSAIGKVLRSRTKSFEIVGVAADHKVRSVGETTAPYVHLAYNQRRDSYGTLVVRAPGDAEALLGEVRRRITALEPNILFIDNQTMATQVSATLFPLRAGVWLITAVGSVAMLLAAIGLYGVIAYSLARRNREIGIRMALGARPSAILALVMRQGLGVAVAGLIVGSLLSAAAARFLGGFLYGVSAADPIAWAAAATMVLMVAALANFVPARRAARIDPSTSLRAE